VEDAGGKQKKLVVLNNGSGPSQGEFGAESEFFNKNKNLFEKISVSQNILFN
jgi:hypothetical protein